MGATSMNASAYPWNIRINMAGISFTGPGFDNEVVSKAIKQDVVEKESVESGEVFDHHSHKQESRSINASEYPWNIRIDVAGVSFTGPGMESRQTAEAMKANIANEESVDNVEVFSQQ